MTHAIKHLHGYRRWHAFIAFSCLTFLMWFNPSGAALAAERPCMRQALLGREEPITISALAGGPEQTVIAKIDTGAKYSSIDMDLARALGLDLAAGETVMMRSALGDQRRPLAEVQLTIAGRTVETVVTVADRGALSTVALVGQNDLKGFWVDSSALRLTTPDGGPSSDTPCSAAARPSAGGMQARPDTMPPSPDRMLLTMLPPALLVVVFFRSLIGVQTFGLFAPVLIALTLVEGAPLAGGVVFGLVLATGLLVHPLLGRLRLARVPRMALLLIVVVLALLAVQTGLQRLLPDGSPSISLPVVVAAMVIEQFWAGWERTGPADALKTGIWTALVTTVTWALLTLSLADAAVDRASFALILAAAAGCIILGRYRGLRLAELWRFRTLMQRSGSELPAPSRLQP